MDVLHAALEIRLSILQILLITVLVLMLYPFYKITERYMPKHMVFILLRIFSVVIIFHYLFWKILKMPH